MRLPFFKKIDAPAPLDDPDSFGNIAVEKGYVTKEKVVEAARIQAERLPLGEVLVSMGALTPFQRDEILLEQKYRRAQKKNHNPDLREQAQIELERQHLVTKHVKSSLEGLTETNHQFVLAHKK